MKICANHYMLINYTLKFNDGFLNLRETIPGGVFFAKH